MADSKILSRIKALLAKANSTDNEHEAEAFLAKAQELLQQHQLNASALGDFDDPILAAQVAFSAAAKSPSWHKNLFIAVGVYYGARVAISTRIERNKNGTWQQVKDVELTGKLSSIETAKVMFPWIKAQCNERGRFLSILYPEMTASQHARRVGNALNNRIARLIAEAKSDGPKTEAARNALVLMDQVEARFKDHYGELKEARQSRSRTNAAAREQAEGIGLHHQAGHDSQLLLG
jgi:hypothetical protein